MIATKDLPTTASDNLAMDYANLKQEGIQHLEKLAGKIWTDFNSHDPGITILEQLCYVLTDLEYRINHSLPDLLASSKASRPHTLFTPPQILSTNPVTLLDWRKLAIDVPRVHNAWIETDATQAVPLFYDGLNHTLRQEGDPLVNKEVQLKGLTRVLLEIPMIAIDTGMSEADVVNEVRNRLHAFRSLGEDFVEIKVLPSQEVGIRATVEIDAMENAEAVMLQICQRLADHISPPVHYAQLPGTTTGRKAN